MAGQPTKIGKYDIIREIGRGGMGKVYGAIDPTIGRMVAIKQVTAVVSDDPDLLKRFYREAQSTGKLQHPNIVTLHDLGEQDGIPYLVMEYLEGDSLEKIIQERQPYTVAEKLHIIIQVCEGLAYAHQRQITHRDIKPGNVVVLRDGGVKIVDFGIAQFGNERYTRTGQVIGSLYYMSPEQIQDADIDSRSDIYSTGIVLYEFLSGTVPFRGKDQTSTLAKILRDSPPSLANSVDVYATELDAVMRRALAKDRNTRYTSMEDFAFDLRSLEEKLGRDLIEGYMRSAETLIGGKQWGKARDQLRQVLKLDKQHRHANEMLREVQTEIQRQQVSEQVRVLRQRADEALGLRNWDEALAALDQAIKIDSGNAALIEFRESVRRSSVLLIEALRRAELAHNAGDLDSAKSAVEEALSVDPYNTTAKALNAILSKEITERSKRKKIDDLVAGARKEVALRHFTAALELLRGAEELDPSAVEVLQLIRSATAGREHEKRRQALEKACGEIEDLLNRDEYSAACAKADEALQSFPQDLGLLKLKGFAEKQREAWSRRQFIDTQIAAARHFADSGELLRAQRILNEALERYPDDSGVHSLLEIVTDGIARQEAQRREAERLANERRRYIRVQLEAAAELQRASQTREALKKIREGLVQYPDSDELKSRASVLEEALAQEEAQRRRAEEEARQKRAEIEKTIAESWQFLSNKQTGEAVTLLDQALRRHPDSPDLKSQLEFAQRRLAVAQAERERAEQEARRRAAEIQKEVAAAQRLLDSRQTDQAVAALQGAVEHYSDSEELNSLLQVAQRRLATERELAERESRRRRAEIEAEIVAARELLESKRTSESVSRLEQALRRYPDSEELKVSLAYARQRLAAEQAAREKAEEEERRRRAWIDAEISATRQWLDGKQADRAVTSLQQALTEYPNNEQLKTQLEFAKRRLAQDQLEREQAEQAAQRRQAEIDREITIGWELLDANKTNQAAARLEKAVQRFPDSKELRSQFELATDRFAAEEAERQRIAEEQRRKLADIYREIVSARQFMELKQTSQAVAALELAVQRFPDSGELKTELEVARERLATEEVEKQRAEQEARRRQEEVKKEMAAATRLLDSGQTVQAVARLEASLRRIPDSDELKRQLQRAQKRFAEEETERQRFAEEQRRKLEELQREIAAAGQFLATKQTNRAIAALELASQRFPDSAELKSQLDSARQRLQAEDAERERIAQETRRRQEEIKKEMGKATALLDSRQAAEAVTSLEASLRRIPDSEELKRQLKRAQERFAEEEAERQRIAEEQRRKLEEIQRETAAARQLLATKQTNRAIAALELASQRFPDSAELKSQLDSARQRLQAEDAERERIAQEARRWQEEVKKEIGKATALLDSRQTAEAVASLEASLRRIPDSDELKLQLKRTIERLAEEEASKRRAEEEKRRRQVAIANALATSKKQLDSRQAAGAVATLEQASRSYPESEELKSQLDTARGRLAAEQAERERAEREAQRRRNDIDREIAAARKQLDARQTSAAATALEGAVRTFPESSELKNLLDTARQRLALELQEKLRVEEERRRRQAEIAAQIAGARTSLESKQTSKAVSALELAARKFPESEELRSMLTAGQKTLAEERAAEEKAAQEALARRQKISAEVESARQLLKLNQTAKAVAKLEEAVARYPESEELRSQLAVGKEQLAREIAEREKSERRQAQLQSERAKVKVLLDANKPEEAVEAIEAAGRNLGKDAKLQELLADAKAALKQKKAEEKRRAAERQQEEEQERQRDRALADLRKLADSSAGAKRTTLEKSLRKAREIASRYPKDAGIQRSLADAESAIQSEFPAEQKAEPTETRFATRLFTPEQPADGNAIPSPVALPARETSEGLSTGILPRLLNKWTVIAVLGLILIAICVKYLVPSKGTVTTQVVNIEAEKQRQALDEADRLVASGDLEGAVKELKKAGSLKGPLSSEIQGKRASIEAATKDVGLRKLRQQEESLWQSAKADSDAGRFQGAQVSLNKILGLPAGGTRREEARNYLDQVLPRRQREETLFAQAKQSAFSKDLPTLAATESSLDSVVQMNGPRKAEAERLRRTVESEVEDIKKLQRDQLLADLQNAARQDIARGDLASARQRVDQIKTSGGNTDTLLTEIEHAQAEKAKSTQYENSFQEAVQQYQQAAASNDKSALERARSSFRAIAQQEGAHARDAQKYEREIESKIVALSSSQPAAPPSKPDHPVLNSTDESAHVRDVIKHYEQAFADRNADELRKIWPNIGDKYASFKKSFELANAQQLEVTIQSLKISDNAEQATVTASTIISYTPRGGKMQRHPDRALFELLRQNGTWVIKDVR